MDHHYDVLLRNIDNSLRLRGGPKLDTLAQSQLNGELKDSTPTALTPELASSLTASQKNHDNHEAHGGDVTQAQDMLQTPQMAQTGKGGTESKQSSTQSRDTRTSAYGDVLFNRTQESTLVLDNVIMSRGGFTPPVR